MTSREKRLAAGVGGIVGLFALILGARVLFLSPLRELDRNIAAAKERIAKIADERRAYFAAEDRLKATARTTFAETVEQASAISGELLTRQILAAGLSEADFARLPVGPRKLRGANEIGWSVQGEGTLTNVINLLFLLDTASWLHRTEQLTLATGESPGRVRVHFSYLTLVLDPPLAVTHTNLTNRFLLASAERRQFDNLALRDLLRPYIKAPPPPPAPPAGPATPAATKPPGPPGPENFRIVSLSEWEGQPEIHVRDLAAQKTQRYKTGDQVAGGTAVLVDYRPMPEPGHPGLQSFSRLILKIDQDYWAIERGKTFAEKHKLASGELPPQLVPAAKP